MEDPDSLPDHARALFFSPSPPIPLCVKKILEKPVEEAVMTVRRKEFTVSIMHVIIDTCFALMFFEGVSGVTVHTVPTVR